MHVSDVLRRMPPVAEQRLGHPIHTHCHKGQKQEYGQPRHDAAKNTQGIQMPVAQIDDIFRKEICNERINGQKIHATFALWDAIEHENDGDAQERIEPCIVHVADVSLETHPPRAPAAHGFPIMQEKQGKQHQQGIWHIPGHHRHHIVPSRVLMRSVCHLAHQPIDILFQHQAKKTLAPLCVGRHIP